MLNHNRIKNPEKRGRKQKNEPLFIFYLVNLERSGLPLCGLETDILIHWSMCEGLKSNPSHIDQRMRMSVSIRMRTAKITLWAFESNSHLDRKIAPREEPSFDLLIFFGRKYTVCRVEGWAMCLLRSRAVVQKNSHCMQVKGFSPECVSVCFLRSPFIVHLYSHYCQLNGFTPVWNRMWMGSCCERGGTHRASVGFSPLF